MGVGESVGDVVGLVDGEVVGLCVGAVSLGVLLGDGELDCDGLVLGLVVAIDEQALCVASEAFSASVWNAESFWVSVFSCACSWLSFD